MEELPVYHLEKVVKAKEDDMEDFNGPLDLILSLLSKSKMEIKDIQISLIVDQYLNWMNQRREMDLEIASDFVLMAAQLIYLKGRMLLSINDEEVISEMEELIASLEEHQRHENYSRIQLVVANMQNHYLIGWQYLVKMPDELTPEQKYVFNYNRKDLLLTMEEVLERLGHKLPPPVEAFHGIVGREPYPVAEKASEIISRLLQNGVMPFIALFYKSKTRSEVVATFLAILELCKASRIHLAGSERECTVTLTSIGAEGEFTAEILTTEDYG